VLYESPPIRGEVWSFDFRSGVVAPNDFSISWSFLCISLTLWEVATVLLRLKNGIDFEGGVFSLRPFWKFFPTPLDVFPGFP